jgi:hypothetical protein
VIKWWFNRVEEDTSGITFQEWQCVATVPMIINSSELRATGFKLKEVFPPPIKGAVRGDLCTRGRYYEG